MYKETNSAEVRLVTIILFAAVLVFLRSALNILPTPPLVGDVLYIAVIIAYVLMLIKRYLSSYEYTLTEEGLVITTQLSGRERGRMEADYSSILCFCPVDDERAKAYNCRSQTFCAGNGRKYAAVIEASGGRVKIIMAPSDNFVSAMEERLQAASAE